MLEKARHVSALLASHLNDSSVGLKTIPNGTEERLFEAQALAALCVAVVQVEQIERQEARQDQTLRLQLALASGQHTIPVGDNPSRANPPDQGPPVAPTIPVEDVDDFADDEGDYDTPPRGPGYPDEDGVAPPI